MIRKATKADLPDIMPELRKFAKYHLHFDEDKFDTEHMYKLCCDMIDNHIFLVSYDGRKLVGFIAGYIHHNLFTTKMKVATEVFWWVCEEWRGTYRGVRLLKEWVRATEANNVEYISVASTEKTPGLEKLYQKFGFQKTETTFVRKI